MGIFCVDLAQAVAVGHEVVGKGAYGVVGARYEDVLGISGVEQIELGIFLSCEALSKGGLGTFDTCYALGGVVASYDLDACLLYTSDAADD